MNNIFKLFFALELFLLFVVGLFIGLGDTLIWIFLTIIIGIFCIRYGLRRGAMHIIAGGFFLIIPGYISDFLGVLLVLNVPILQILTQLGLLNSLHHMGDSMGNNQSMFNQHFTHTHTRHETHTTTKHPRPDNQSDDIIDGDFTRKDD